MNCEACTELLADFLLDELPESQAVLVHEHLNLCPACMKTYRELKGTGKALEAVPVLRPTQPSPQFGQAVRAQAGLELAQIVERLSPEKRVRLEARRAARLSQAHARIPQPSKAPWATPLLLVAAVALAAAGALFVVSRRDPAAMPRGPLGKLTLTNGKADQSAGRQGSPRAPAQQGREVLPGDAFLTADDGRARFELNDGTAVFLGPLSSAIFKAAAGGAPVLDMQGGQLGMQRGSNPAGGPLEIQCAPFRIMVDGESQVYLRMQKTKDGASGDISVLHGTVRVYRGSDQPIALAAAGTRVTLDGPRPPVSEALAGATVPAWRAELASEEDLKRFIGAPCKIVGRSSEGIEVELAYGRAAPLPASGAAAGQEDWSGENGESLIARADGSIVLPQRAKLRHAVPFAAPLAMELAIDGDSPQDAPFAFGALESRQCSVAVDVGNAANLEVREAGQPSRAASVPARKMDQAGRLRLDVVRENGGLTAVLGAAGGKSKIVPMRLAKASGTLWLHGLGAGVILDEIRITAVIPTGWLREALAK